MVQDETGLEGTEAQWRECVPGSFLAVAQMSKFPAQQLDGQGLVLLLHRLLSVAYRFQREAARQLCPYNREDVKLASGRLLSHSTIQAAVLLCCSICKSHRWHPLKRQ